MEIEAWGIKMAELEKTSAEAAEKFKKEKKELLKQHSKQEASSTSELAQVC